MAQAATRQRSAVRERHAAHPSRPRAAEKPGKPSSANGASGSKPGGGSGRSARAGSSARGGGTDDSGSGSGESKLGAWMENHKPRLPGGGELALRKPHLPASHLPKPHLSIWTRLVLKILKKIAKHELGRLTKATNWNLESVAGDELAELKEKLGDVLADMRVAKPQLPIQEAVDVAVPIGFAWNQWMELQFLPEGVDRVIEIERQDGSLSGQLEGSGDAAAWRAEVLDERERESFAWKSSDGSDCAGLVTFHPLGERLTRLELTLDVLPHDPLQAGLLLTHIAHRRARRDLRRFKADLEVVSPDVYGGEDSSRRANDTGGNP